MAVNVVVPPQNIDAERSVLGALMMDGAAWVKIQGVVNEHDFYVNAHQILFRALFEMFADDLPVDVVTVSEFLEKKQFLQRVGGLSALVVFAKGTPSSANIVAYADIVREKSLLRRLVAVSGVINEQALAADSDAKSVIAAAESAIFEISQLGLRGKKGFSKLQDVLKDVVDLMEDNMEKPPEGVLGLATGFTDLDSMLSGLQGGNLIIVAARPSMGKTAFSINVAEHVAISGHAVAVFSMEMQERELAQRILSSQSTVGLKNIRESWTLTDNDWPYFTTALSKVGKVPLFIDDTPMLTVADIRSRCMRLQTELGDDGLGLIVIDYLQLMGTDLKGDTRNNQIEDITRGLKRLAKDFDVPIICLSQLNRNLESRPNKRPVMSDLRESGGIEQDADVILFLYRDEVYNDDSPSRGLAEVIISKQRNGALGTVNLQFDGACTRFRNIQGYDQ